jgi:hypothetical protein
MEIELLLPSTLTGQEGALILKGPAKIKRLDAERWGVAVEFLKELKTFEASKRY